MVCLHPNTPTFFYGFSYALRLLWCRGRYDAEAGAGTFLALN